MLGVAARGARTALIAGIAVAMCGSLAAEAAVQKVDGGFVGGARGDFTGGGFTEPSDVAVYRGGAGGGRKLFVVEAAGARHSRVQRLDGDGNFELAWGRDAVRAGARGDRGTGFEVCRASVSGSAGCKASPAGGREGELRMPTAVAVSDATGDVYVMDHGNRRVQQFDRDGRFLGAWGWGVATGVPRYEVCRRGCRPGRVGRSEGDANAGQFAGAERGLFTISTRFPVAGTGAIAISPEPPHHVFVGDEGNSRVLEFTATGRFIRGWGWGVAGGGQRFESCTRATGCQRGQLRPGGGWPRHLAVDEGGVVYGSERERDSDVVRFESSAGGKLLAPFTIRNLLNGGFTVGLAVDASTEELAVARDPFGPMVVDEVSDPAASFSAPAAQRPRVVVQQGLTYLGSINGVDTANGTVYLAKSAKLNPNDPVVRFNSCGSAKSTPCNGLALLSPRGPVAAIAMGAAAHDGAVDELVGALSAPGAVRWRFQVSPDGRYWRDLPASRSIIGGPARVVVTAGRLRPRLYQSRLVIDSREVGGSTVSNSVPLVVAGNEPQR